MVNRVSSSVSNKIRNMSFVCACLVVLIHITRHVARDSGAWWLFAIGSESVCRIAVPFFFLVSGFFIAGHFDETNCWHDALRKRARTILIPYLLVESAYATFCSVLIGRINFASLGNFIGLNLFDTPYLSSLWYLRMLMLLVFCLPLVRVMVVSKKRGFVCTLLLMVGWLLFTPWTGGNVSAIQKFFLYGISIEGIAFYVAGAYLRLHLVEIKMNFCMVLSFALFALAIRVVCLWCDFEYHHVILHLSIPFVMLAIWMIVPSRAWPLSITALAMPIYLLHKFVIFIVSGGFRRLAVCSYCESTVLGYVSFYLLILFATVTVCVVLRH